MVKTKSEPLSIETSNSPDQFLQDKTLIHSAMQRSVLTVNGQRVFPKPEPVELILQPRSVASNKNSVQLIGSVKERGIFAKYVSITCDCIPFHIDLQEETRRLAKREWISGTFEKSFPELNERTKNVKSLDVEELTTELNDQANRDIERIEMFGAKIPANLFINWGIVLLLSCQLYLYLHLNMLWSYLPDPGVQDSYWIGLFPNVVARSFVAMSALMLPILIASTLVVDAWAYNSFSTKLIQSLGIIASVALSFLTGSIFTRIWSMNLTNKDQSLSSGEVSNNPITEPKR